MMKHLFLCSMLLCLLVSIARGQDPANLPSERGVVLDVKVVDMDVLTTEDMDRIAKDRAKLEQMITQGKAKVVLSTQLQAASNQQNSVRTGQRVPVQTATLTATASIPQIQYENTGFNFSFTPRVLPGDFVEIRFTLEISALDDNTGRLTPTFVQRTLNGTARLKQNETAMFFGVTQSEALLPKMMQADKNNTSPLRGNFCVLLRARLL